MVATLDSMLCETSEYKKKHEVVKNRPTNMKANKLVDGQLPMSLEKK